MRPVDHLSSHISLPDVEARYLSVSGVHRVDLAMAIGATVVVIAIVAVLDIVSVIAIKIYKG